MTRIFVHGLGAVSPAGWGVPALCAALGKNQPLPAQPLARPGWQKTLWVRSVPAAPVRPAFLVHPAGQLLSRLQCSLWAPLRCARGPFLLPGVAADVLVGLSGRVGEAQAPIIFEAVPGRPSSGRKRKARYALEISNAGIAPPLRLVALNLQEGRHFLPALPVDYGRDRGPGPLHLVDGRYAAIVAIHKLSPDIAATRRGICPSSVVKPK